MKKFALGCAMVAQLLYPVHATARTKDFALQGYALPADKDVTVVLMRPDVDVGELQAGGVAEPNAEWTESARANIEAALRAELATRSINFVDMETQRAGYLDRMRESAVVECTAQQKERLEAESVAEAAYVEEVEEIAEEAAEEAPTLTEEERAAQEQARLAAEAEANAAEDAARAREITVCAQEIAGQVVDADKLVAEYNALHGAVVDAILIHKYGMGPRDVTLGTVLFGGLVGGGSGELPSKKDQFRYTLGPGTAALGEVAQANYGLFVMTNDQFASAGRKTMQVLGGLGCIIGACMIVSGGTHVAYVSLVELETGNIVWFNMQRGSEGDVREADGAQKMVATILEGMPGQRSVAVSGGE